MEKEVWEVVIGKKRKSYAILPDTVLFDNDLSPRAILIYAAISKLSKSKGFCFATNRYFADSFHVSISSVSKWIHELEKKGYITIQFERNGKQIALRKIYLVSEVDGVLEFINHPKDVKGCSKICNAPLQPDTKDNNHKLNTLGKEFCGIYGELQNVYLSDDEYRRLIGRCGNEMATILINDLSYHLASTYSTYRSHYITLLSWYRRRAEKKVKNPSRWYRDPSLENEE